MFIRTEPQKPSLRKRVSEAEWETRVELAACYRLAAAYRMTDMIYTHISARVPGTEDFLINAYGMLFDEITASSLVKLTLEGEIVEDETGLGVNQAGYVIHSAVHGARADVGCVMHSHAGAGLAVAAQKDGLLPLTQHSMRFTGCLSYHDYEGPSLELGERERLQANLGDSAAMILRNHGLLVTGRSVPEAFIRLYRLERACQIQVDAGAAGTLNILGDNLAAKSGADMDRFAEMESGGLGDLKFAALIRKLDKVDTSWRH